MPGAVRWRGVVGAVRTSGSLRHAGVALTVAVLAALLLLSGTASAARKARVAVSIPDEGQLAASRLSFKATGTTKPKLKVSVKNEDELPAGVVVASQAARVKQPKTRQGRSEKKKSRAAVLVAIGNVPGAGAARRGRGTEQVLIEVKILEVEHDSPSLRFLQPNSRSFLSVFGAEPPSERSLAQETFGLNPADAPLNANGALSLKAALDEVGMRAIGKAFAIPGDVLAGLDPEAAIASAVAAAIGPPATLDAKTYGLLSGRPVPTVRSYTYGPSPTDSHVLFNHATYSAPVSGAQVAPTTGLQLSFTPDMRCSTGDGHFGLIIRLEIDSLCRLPDFDDGLFFDVPFKQVPPAGAEVGVLLPIPVVPGASPGGDPGEALGGPGVTAVIG